MGMIPEGNLISNVERFSGFQSLYDQYRPEAPVQAVETILQYLGGRPSKVVDIGCGTGLSTFVWSGYADEITGIEPNADMMGIAEEKLRKARFDVSPISFRQGYSNRLEMADGSVDVVTCSQSFHWMDPASTLSEVSRILKEGGVFAAYDCDWPPVIDWRIEDSFVRLLARSNELVERLVPSEAQAKKGDKDRHLPNIIASQAFRYAREVVFHNKEICTEERFIGLALSQGGLQTVLKLGAAELQDEIERFENSVRSYFDGREAEMLLSYRMRLGVK